MMFAEQQRAVLVGRWDDGRSVPVGCQNSTNEAIEACQHRQACARAHGTQDPTVGEDSGKDPPVSVEPRIVEAASRGKGRHRPAGSADVLLDGKASTWVNAAVRPEAYEGGREIEPIWGSVLDGHHQIAERWVEGLQVGHSAEVKRLEVQEPVLVAIETPAVVLEMKPTDRTLAASAYSALRTVAYGPASQQLECDSAFPAFGDRFVLLVQVRVLEQPQQRAKNFDEEKR